MPDIGFFRGLITLLTLIVFLGVCWWAFRPSSRRRFEQDARIPFEDRGPVAREQGEQAETDVDENGNEKEPA